MTNWIPRIEEPLVIDDQEILQDLEKIDKKHTGEFWAVTILCTAIMALMALLWWLT